MGRSGPRPIASAKVKAPVVNTVTPSRRPFVVASIMLATFMAAIEGTIVATAMPSIVGQLGGFSYYSWVFSAFLLAQSTTTVIYGKLADLLGRKPVLIAGIVLLLIGSLLCGFAWSMTSLIAFRMVQGLGAGAITPVTMTVIGDLYRLEERGRAQGMMAASGRSPACWVRSRAPSSSPISHGPGSSGSICRSARWRSWDSPSFCTRRSRRTGRGSTISARCCSAISIGSLLILLTETDAARGTLAALGLVFLATGVLFLRHERRTPEPIISIELWARRLVATSNIATLLAGMAMIALMTVLPIYVQGAMGRSPRRRRLHFVGVGHRVAVGGHALRPSLSVRSVFARHYGQAASCCRSVRRSCCS